MKKNRVYKNLLMCFFIICVAAIVILAFVGNISVIRNYTNKIVEESLKDEIRQNNNYIKAYLNNNIEIVQNTANRVTEEKLQDKYALSNELNTLLRGISFSDAIYIDEKGYMYMHDGTCKDVRDNNIFIKAYNTKKVYISNAMGEEKIDYNSISITVPIFVGGTYKGCLYAVKNISKLKEYVKDVFSYANGFAYVIDENGYIIFRVSNGYDDENCINIYHYMAYGDVGLADYSEGLKDDVKGNRSDIFQVGQGAHAGYFGYAPVLSSSNWTTVSYINSNDITEFGRELSDKTIEIVASVIVITMLVALYIVIIQIMKVKQLKKIAYRDNLTGINNQLAFEDYASKCIRNNTDIDYAAVIFDIKKFKYVNYRYGYDYGDKIIKKVATSLQKKYYGKEVCARIESDTFILLLKQDDGFEDNLKDYLDKIINRNIAVLNFRFGIYKDINHKQNITDIIEKVNLAWKYIKSDRKKDISYYNDKLLDDIINEERLESKMEKALEDGQFKVYLQPKVDLSTDKICGAEALVRWISKDMGFMPPGKFIPLFEKNGFISKIDFYMLEEVFKIIKNWNEQGIDYITVSVNQSRETINDSRYLEKILDIVNRYDVNLECIELEITESVFVENHDRIIDILKSLKNIGFKVSMDDFGSGYSSLNLLSEMPIDVLKIDRMFFNGTIKTEKSRVIIKSVIDMAKKLNIAVICEGVETDGQVEFLKKSKCKMAQGFFYSKPIPTDEFNDMIF